MISQQAIEAAAAAATQEHQLAAALESQPQLLVQDQFKVKAAHLANSAPSSIVKKQSTATGTPDVGILSKNYRKNIDKEKQPVDKKFAIHRKKRAVEVDVDVGILDQRRQGGGQWQQQQTSLANLHDKNEVTGRSLQNDIPSYVLAKMAGMGGCTSQIYSTRPIITFLPRRVTFPSAAAPVQPRVDQSFVSAWSWMPMVTSCSAWIH